MSDSEGLLQFPEEDAHDEPGSGDNSSEEDPDLDENHYTLPTTITALREKLYDGYTVPPNPPFPASPIKDLTQSEFYSLRHYLSWVKSNGTVEAYILHARNLAEALGEEILHPKAGWHIDRPPSHTD